MTLIPVLALVGGAVYVFNFTSCSTMIYGMGKGNKEYAERWRDAFRDIDAPEAAQARSREVHARRFDNGEWAFGVCSDSHSSHRGGTIVVKDSRGQTHAYFGHVCGSGFLDGLLHGPKTLDEFYRHEAWKNFQFHEYDFSESP